MFRKRFRKIRYNKKRMFSILFLYLFLLGMSLGYAFLTTTLSIEGVGNVSKATWDVHFENIQSVEGSVSPTTSPSISNNTTVSFAATLENPGEFYSFLIDIVNDGTINAMISSIEITPTLTEAQKKYFDYEVTYKDGVELAENQLLEAGATETIKVMFQYIENEDTSYYPEEDQNFSFTVSLEYSQALSQARSRKHTRIISPSKTVNTLAIGDEICMGDECFHVISTSDTSVTLLAKYNLYVGEISSSDVYVSTISESDPRYLKQNADAIGSRSGTEERIATIMFQTRNDWYYSGIVYPYELYDDTKNAKPEISSSDGKITTENYSIAYYVQQYKKYLVDDLGATVSTARLLTYQEAVSLGCDFTARSCNNDTENIDFLKTTSFWLGTASTDDFIYVIHYGGECYANGYYWNSRRGVRPVIVIPKESIS